MVVICIENFPYNDYRDVQHKVLEVYKTPGIAQGIFSGVGIVDKGLPHW